MHSLFRRALASLIAALLLAAGTVPQTAYADDEWPSDCYIDASAGIVMDASTGVVLYGKDIHSTYAPASITKVLTALIVLEQCDLNETVTFSRSAVNNVEANSSTAGYESGDSATVETLLYALLLKSANEAANALAEHVSGTTKDFAVLMNEKAKELGCVDSHFANPSGLNNANHYVSAYDMGLITAAALKNETFARIVGTPYYELPPNGKYPDGQGISPGNKMVKSNWKDQYRPDVIGGKTGYTSIAMNTLVNGARREDFTIVTVVLHSDNTQYEDTARMMDFAFANFQSLPAAGAGTDFSYLEDDLTFAGMKLGTMTVPAIDSESRITIPKSAQAGELTWKLDYTARENAPSGAVGQIRYYLGDTPVGSAWLTLRTSDEQYSSDPVVNRAVQSVLGNPEESSDDVSEEDKDAGAHSSDSDSPVLVSLISQHRGMTAGLLAALFVFVLGSLYLRKQAKEDALESLKRRARRAERLQEEEDEYDLLPEFPEEEEPEKDNTDI